MLCFRIIDASIWKIWTAIIGVGFRFLLQILAIEVVIWIITRIQSHV